jgi:hypothetical protein
MTAKEAASGVDSTADGQEPDWSSASTVAARINEKSSDEEVQKLFAQHLNALARSCGISDFHIELLFDERDEITNWHADKIYRGASLAGDKKHKNILLVINSPGGQIEPAYLISKTCKRLATGSFLVAVPRKAKSAATLIALGADEIHMGLMSELGPIDPQIGGLPTLGLQNSLSILADLACKYPAAAEMLGKYLSDKLNLNVLGYFNRVTQSAAQYAERLLTGKPLPASQTAERLADHFVNHYKDHSFVIDADESSQLLGPKIVKQNTPVYKFANAMYESLSFLEFATRILMKKTFDYVGTIDGGLTLREVKTPPP